MKSLKIFLGCSIFFLLLCFQAVGADKQQFCKDYADSAVKQYKLGKQHRFSGIVPPAWSDDYKGHFNWCMNVPENLANSERVKRQTYLDKNTPKQPSGNNQITGTFTAEAIDLPDMVAIARAAQASQPYLGCFRDQKNRDLSGYSFKSSKMTKQLCMNTCQQKGFSYAGLQYSQYCFCGNSYGRLGKADNCNMPCAGNKKETCGGGWANSVYRVEASSVNNTAIAATQLPSVHTGELGLRASVQNLRNKLEFSKPVDLSVAQQLLGDRARITGKKSKELLSPLDSPMFDIYIGGKPQAASIGRGYDSILKTARSPALIPIPNSEIKEIIANGNDSFADYAKNSEEYYHHLGLKVDVSGGYLFYSGSSSTTFEQEKSNSRFTETLAAHSDIETFLQFPKLTQLRLNDEAKQTLISEGVKGFYNKYGDAFIYAIQYGAGCRGTVSYNRLEEKKSYKFSNKTSAGANALVWSANLSVETKTSRKERKESENIHPVFKSYGISVKNPVTPKDLLDIWENFPVTAHQYAMQSKNNKFYGAIIRYTLIKYSSLPEFINLAGGVGKLDTRKAISKLTQLGFYERKLLRMRNNLIYIKNHPKEFNQNDYNLANNNLNHIVIPALDLIKNDIGMIQRDPFNNQLLDSIDINKYKAIKVNAPSSQFVEVIVDFPHEFRDQTPGQTAWDAQVGPLMGWPHISGDSQIASSGKIDVNINSELEISADKKNIWLHQKLLIHENKPDHTKIGGKKRLKVYTAPDGYKIVGLKQSRADYYHLRNLRGDGYIPVADVLNRDNGAPTAKADDLWEELYVIFDNGGAVDHLYTGLYGKMRMFVELEELAPKE